MLHELKPSDEVRGNGLRGGLITFKLSDIGMGYKTKHEWLGIGAREHDKFGMSWASF